MEEARIGTVKSREGDSVTLAVDGELVTVPMDGFPSGFELRPGERAMYLVQSKVAKPLVMTTIVDEEDDVSRGASLTAAAKSFRVSDAAVVLDPARSGKRMVWYVDPGDAEGPAQIIASRPA